MENKHSILYDYYSKYNGGNPLRRLASAVPSVVRSASHAFAPEIKEFFLDTADIVREGVRNNIRDNVATELFQGNNPFNSLKKNIDERIKNMDEVRYNNLYNKELSSNIHLPVINQALRFVNNRPLQVQQPLSYTSMFLNSYKNPVNFNQHDQEEDEEEE